MEHDCKMITTWMRNGDNDGDSDSVGEENEHDVAWQRRIGNGKSSTQNIRPAA